MGFHEALQVRVLKVSNGYCAIIVGEGVEAAEARG